MTAESIALIRSAYSDYLEGDVTAIADLIDPDLEWTFLDPSDETPTPQICHGREQLVFWMMRRSNQGQRASLEEITDFGDRVLVVTRITRFDDPSSPDTDRRRYHVLTLAGGRIVALRACRDQPEAMELASGNARSA